MPHPGGDRRHATSGRTSGRSRRCSRASTTRPRTPRARTPTSARTSSTWTAGSTSRPWSRRSPRCSTGIPTLRAGFTGEPRPHQVIAARRPGGTSSWPRATPSEIARRDRETPFDLDRPPLVRLTVIRRRDGGDRLLLTCHFLLWDGWSRELVLRELFALYDSRGEPGRAAARRPRLPGLPRLARRTRRRRRPADAWRTAIGEPTIVAPEAAGREPMLSERVLAALPTALTTRLGEQARRAGVTLNSVLTAALGIVLGHRTGRSDVVFGTTVAGRPTDLPGIENVIGLFLNTVPVRVAAAPGEPLADLARRVQDDRIDAEPARLARPRRHPPRRRPRAAVRHPLRAAELPGRRHLRRPRGARRASSDVRVHRHHALPADLGAHPGREPADQAGVPARRDHRRPGGGVGGGAAVGPFAVRGRPGPAGRRGADGRTPAGRPERRGRRR